MSILIGFVCILLSGFLLVVKSPRRTPNRFLAAFLTLTAIELTVWLWGASEVWNWLGPIWIALGKLQMPAFFFFFFSTCYSDLRLKLHDALHLVPSVLALVLSTPGAIDLEILTAVFTPGTQASWVVSQLTYFAYMTAVFLLLWRFRKRFRQHFSGAPSEVLTWLTQLAAASLFARVTILIRDFSVVNAPGALSVGLQVFGALVALAITTWIALKSLLQPQLFRNVDRRLLRLEQPNQSQGREDLKRLVEHVKTEQPYLDPDLTLAELSDQVAMIPREVSELLNQSLGLHFFDFINGHRIDYAKELLLTEPSQSILDILLASGFNSKSSFNTAFKKQVGMTPSAFRKHGKTQNKQS
ncbi:MAG: AraC family transcriptional regulator [Henriciella sp.]